MSEQKVILSTSDEAARHVENISGWVSRHGRFYGRDERAARWDGCTHVRCADCETIIPKSGLIVCGTCAEKRDVGRYEALEKRPYAGGMVYSGSHDRFFDSLEDAMEYAEDEEIDPAALRLVLCEPSYAREIDTDHWADDLPEEANGDLPGDLLEALEIFNTAIREGKFILSWAPSKYAVEL